MPSCGTGRRADGRPRAGRAGLRGDRGRAPRRRRRQGPVPVRPAQRHRRPPRPARRARPPRGLRLLPQPPGHPPADPAARRRQCLRPAHAGDLDRVRPRREPPGHPLPRQTRLALAVRRAAAGRHARRAARGGAAAAAVGGGPLRPAGRDALHQLRRAPVRPVGTPGLVGLHPGGPHVRGLPKAARRRSAAAPGPAAPDRQHPHLWPGPGGHLLRPARARQRRAGRPDLRRPHERGVDRPVGRPSARPRRPVRLRPDGYAAGVPRRARRLRDRPRPPGCDRTHRRRLVRRGGPRRPGGTAVGRRPARRRPPTRGHGRAAAHLVQRRPVLPAPPRAGHRRARRARRLAVETGVDQPVEALARAVRADVGRRPGTGVAVRGHLRLGDAGHPLRQARPALHPGGGRPGGVGADARPPRPGRPDRPGRLPAALVVPGRGDHRGPGRAPRGRPVPPQQHEFLGAASGRRDRRRESVPRRGLRPDVRQCGLHLDGDGQRGGPAGGRRGADRRRGLGGARGAEDRERWRRGLPHVLDTGRR